MTREALDLKISGVVQGVGFRPFVYREAKKQRCYRLGFERC